MRINLFLFTKFKYNKQMQALGMKKVDSSLPMKDAAQNSMDLQHSTNFQLKPTTNKLSQQVTNKMRSKHSVAQQQENGSSSQKTQQQLILSKFLNCQQEKNLKFSQKQGMIQMKSISKKVKKGRKKQKMLKQIVSKQKVKKLVRRFIENMQQNIVFLRPVNFSGYNSIREQTRFQKEGFTMNSYFDHLVSLISITLTTFIFIFFTLGIVFPQITQHSFPNIMQGLSIGFYFFEIGYQSVTKKEKAGKKLNTFAEILKDYKSTCMFIDIVNLLMIILDIYSAFQCSMYLRLVIIVKLLQHEEIKKIQIFFIKNIYHEQYWSLFKLLIMNLMIAHIFAIVLTAITNIDEPQTWHTAHDIEKANWLEKYVWAYYWGSNMILTVGFKGIAASNSKEALCLIFIQIISAVCLAYNIKSVITTMGILQSLKAEKNKNAIIFKHLSAKFQLSNALYTNISNHIEQNNNAKNHFFLEQQQKFLQCLPKDLQKQYKRQSKKNDLQLLPFFRTLTEKTLQNLAEIIQVKCCYPDLTFKKLDDSFNLYILKEGTIKTSLNKIGYYDQDESALDVLSVKQNQRPKLLSIQFLSIKRNNFQLKSASYSLIFFAEYQNLMQAFRKSQNDHINFCYLRDKQQAQLDRYPVFECQFCRIYSHAKSECPKLHYVPLKKHIIYKYMSLVKLGKNTRKDRQNFRVQNDKQNCLFFIIQNNQKHLVANKKLMGEDLKTSNKMQQSKKTLTNLAQVNQTNPRKYNSLDEIIMQNTKETINKQFLKQRFYQKYQDQLWIVSCDQLADYRSYFEEKNPKNLRKTSLTINKS